MAESIIKSPIITHTSSLAYNIDISSYTSANPYTVPTDGYVWVRTTGNCEIHLQSINNSVKSPGGNFDASVFVQKGVTVYVSGTVSLAYFRAYGIA